MPLDESRLAPWTKLLWDRSSWEWQPVEPVVADAMRLVPPGKALRRYQDRSAAARERAGAKKADYRELSEAEQIASGQRAFARDGLSSLRTNGHLETEDGPEGQYFRRRSQVGPADRCPHCGRPGAEVKPGSPPGARPDESRGPAGDGRPGVVVPFERERSREADSEQLREALEERDRDSEPTMQEVLLAVSELVTVVESMGKRIDATMQVARSAQSAAEAAKTESRAAKQQAQMTAMAARNRQRTRGGRDAR